MASRKDLDAEVTRAQNIILSHYMYEQRAESADVLQHQADVQHPPSKWSLVCSLLISQQSPSSGVIRLNLEPACLSATAVYVSQTRSLRNRAVCLERGRLMTIFLLVQV